MEVESPTPCIWLSAHGKTWEEWAIDKQGKLDILSIAAWASMRLEGLMIGDYRAHTDITIKHLQSEDGKAGSSKELAVPIVGKPLPAAQSEEAPPLSKKPKLSLDEMISAQAQYLEELLEPPLELPVSVAEIEEHLKRRPVKLPVHDEAIYLRVSDPQLLTLDSSEDALASVVACILRSMERVIDSNEATSTAKLYQITGQFIELVNNLAPASRLLVNLLVLLDSSNPKSTRAASKPVEQGLRPDLQVFVKGCLMLRWENQVDYADFAESELENTSKLKTWSPLYYGNLPYVIGGCCAGNQFQWLRLMPNENQEIISELIPPSYDLTSLKGVAAFLHSNIQMFGLLQKMQDCLSESIKVRLYQINNRGNGVTVSIYPDFVEKKISEADTVTGPWRKLLYTAIKDAKYLIKGEVATKGSTTVLKLTPAGDPVSVPVNLDELEHATHDILCGLHELHTAGYTHRDIRWPNCIKITSMGVHKWILIDLEAAGLDGDEWHDSNLLKDWDDHTLEGTTKKYTKASDRYQLGKLVHEWLDKKSSAGHENRYQVMKAREVDLMNKALPESKVKKLFCKPSSCERCKRFVS